MKNSRTLSAIILGVFAFATGLGARAQEQAKSGDEGLKVIEVTAKKYEFTPNEIHVKKGERVQIKVHSVDTEHGIKLSLHPQGSREKSPGLLFNDPAQNGKVEGKEQVLEFVAQQPGTYLFKCAKICGFGHGRMKGKLVVEESEAPGGRE